MRIAAQSPTGPVLFGDSESAKRRLERLASREDATAATWSDYAGLLHDTAARGDAFALTTALAAADHALDIDASLPEALFNRGVILETLAFRSAAAKAYDDYLKVDPASQWSAEVKDRLKRLRSGSKPAPQPIGLTELQRAAASDDVLFINDAAITSPERMRLMAQMALTSWGRHTLAHNGEEATALLNVARILGTTLERQFGDAFLADTVRAIDSAKNPALLAKAYVVYAEARHRAIPGSVSAAAELRESERLFATNGSPMALDVRFLAQRWESISPKGSRRGAIEELSQRTPPRYRLLTANIELSRAYAAARDGLAREATMSFRTAGEAYQALGEESGTNATRSGMAAVYSAIGDTAEAWRLRSEMFGRFARREDECQLVSAAYGAASDALRDNRFDLAHSLLNVVVESPNFFRHVHDEALVWRGAAANRAGLARTARRHLNAAQDALRTRTDNREDLMADSLIVAALIYGAPERATIWWEQVFDVDRRRVDGVPYLARGETFSTNNSRSARQDEMVTTIVRPADGLLSRSVRHFFLTRPFDTFRLLAERQDRDGHTLEAITSLDLYRLQDRSADVFMLHLPERWYRAIPADSVLISYGIFGRNLVIYAAHSNGVERASVSLSPADVERLTLSFGQALHDREDRASRMAGNGLYRVLIAPVATVVAKARSIVVIPDPTMRQIPFPALMQSNGRYLIEDHAVVVAPSITSYLKSLHTKRATSRAVLAVGDALLSERLKSLGPLNGAGAEAKEIAAMYPSRALLVRGDATKQRVMSALGYCDVAHFAVHAAVALNDVDPPHLILSESPEDDGRLGASEVAELRLDGIRTVVLAGCRTAVAVPRRRETRSLVDGFLTAGAGSVIGALWEIDDGITRELSIEIHRALRNGETPAAALRTAQLLMIGSKTNARSPSEWAALQLYGSGL